MQRFTIDYLTGNTGGSYLQSTSPDAEIYVSGHDGLLTSSGSNYLHTSLHLEDVYSVINKDTANSGTSPLVTSPLVIDSSYESQHCETSPTESNQESSQVSESDVSDITTLSSSSYAQSGSDYQYTLERATPSPCKDSGIDSDNSPASNSSSNADDVKKSLHDLEKKADKVLTSKSSSSEKPSHSYIALIAMAIIDSRDRKLTLSDIYRHIMENHPYYNNEEKAWRNSIRYNLSINECFIKAGKDEITGKGNLWAIHPACFDSFKNGDFRRRQARRRAKRTLKGLGPADSTEASVGNNTRAGSAYQTMTPSYVNYHPYSTSGLAQRHQQMNEYAHAYSGHTAMPSASYYSTVGQYHGAQYPLMSMSAYSQPTYDYTKQYSSFYTGYEVPNTAADSVDKSTQNHQDQKYYSYSHTGYETRQQEHVPINNKIEIL